MNPDTPGRGYNMTDESVRREGPLSARADREKSRDGSFLQTVRSIFREPAPKTRPEGQPIVQPITNDYGL